MVGRSSRPLTKGAGRSIILFLDIVMDISPFFRFWVNCKVYTAMILVIGLAVAVVIAKVSPE